jgi:general secretion pathway protein M
MKSLSSLVQPLFEKSGWQRLDRREKIMVAGLGAFVFVFLLYTLFFAPLLTKRTDLQKSLVKKEIQLQEIRAMQQEYRLLQTESTDIKSRIGRRPEGFTLFSFIEQQAAKTRVKKHIKYMKPSEVERESNLQESRVDMKIQEITTENLVAFLQRLESEENVIYVNRLSIKEHGKEAGYLNAVIQVLTFHLKDGGV